MKHYTVILEDRDCEDCEVFFNCQADDKEHAKEQALDMYPDCKVIRVSRTYR